MSHLYSSTELKKLLTPDQFSTIFRRQTEHPFKNKYWNFFQPGIYKCIVCDSPLFSSQCKYEDGFGWPAFYDVCDGARVRILEDHQLDYVRMEVSCGKCWGHVGYVFNDGPRDKTGKRYCVNSASLKFYPSNTKNRK